MAKLRESLTTTTSPLSAEKLANFLVQKQHLTQGQANDILAGLTQSGVNLAEEDAETMEASEDSSVFASNIFVAKKVSTPPPEEEDEIRLVPLEEDAAETKKSRAINIEEDVPSLGLVAPEEPPRPRRSSDQPGIRIAEVVEGLDVGEGVNVGPIADPPSIKEAAAAARRATRLGRDGKKDQRRKNSQKIKRPGTRHSSSWVAALSSSCSLPAAPFGSCSIGNQAIKSWPSRESAQERRSIRHAIEHFQEFLTSSPRHAEHSLARVELAMLRIRQPTEANDFEQALTAAETEVQAIEEEEAFKKGSRRVGLAHAANCPRPGETGGASAAHVRRLQETRRAGQQGSRALQQHGLRAETASR